MRNKIWSVICVLAAVLSAGCEKEPDGLKSDRKPVLELAEKVLVADAAGGRYYMMYDLENPDGSEFSVTCSQSWCHNFVFDQEESRVYFIVDANTTGSIRQATIYVNYGDVKAKFVLSQPRKSESLDDIQTMTFDIQYEIDGPHVTMTVTPQYNSVRYYVAYSTKAEVDALSDPQAAIKANVERFLQGEINALMTHSGYSLQEALEEYTYVGEKTVSMSLNGESDFVGWCCAIDQNVKVISAVTLKPFRTGSIPPSDNVLNVTVNEINCDRVKYSVSTTNEDQWATLVLPASDVDGKTDAELRALFNSSEDVTRYLHFGDWNGTILSLAPGQDYYILAFGYRWGFETTDIIKVPFTTITLSDDPAHFSFTVDKYTHYRAECTVECTPITQLYYVSMLFPGENIDAVMTELIKHVNWMVSEDYGSKIDLMRAICKRGKEKITAEDLDDNAEHKFFAVAVDEATGEFILEKDANGTITGGVYYSETFTTPAERVSQETISVVADKWFSGAEYAEAYPEDGAGFEDSVILPASVEVSSGVRDYWYCVYAGDLTNANQEGSSDHDLIDDMLAASDDDYVVYNQDSFVFILDYDRTYTVVAVAYDDDDNWTVVSRKLIRPTKSNCSPWSEYPVAPATAKKFAAKAKPSMKKQ